MDGVNLYLLDQLKQKIFIAFQEALKLHDEKNFTNNNYNHFVKRVDRGSLDLDCLYDSEILSINLVENLKILEIAKQYWNCKKIKYSKSHSKFRYVNPLNEDQKKYCPLHYDGVFLNNRKSINICIPFTGYGGKYPGLKIFPETDNFIKKKMIEKTQRFDFLNIFLSLYKPSIECGSYVCFNQNVYHKRTIKNCTQTRVNLEFRIFPDYIDDEDLDLKFL